MFISPVQTASYSTFNANPKMSGVVVNGKKLIPLSEHKGPVLKLTAGDKKVIAALREKIAALEIELIKFKDFFSKHNFGVNSRSTIDNRIICMEAQIKSWNEDINNIKRQRYLKQQEKFAK